MQSEKKSQPVVLACSHVSKNFEELHLLKDVDFTVRKGEKVGLVGPNGSGKSTLLKIIAGILEKDGGTVTHAKDAEIRYFPQVHMEQGNMSGGEIAKRVLAPIVSSDANLFLLDEPTNNLDIDGLLMVEHFVLKSNKTFLIVSHDREFLDKTVDKIIEIDSVTQSSFVYDGNYSEYIKERTERIERQWKEFEAKTERAEKLENSVDQRLTWMKEIEKTRKGIKNLPMHEKEKPVAAVLRDKEAKAGKRARIMKDRLEKFKESTEEIVRPKRVLPLQVVFDNERGGTKVFDLAGVEKRIGKRHIGPIDLHIQYGDRLHIVGKNGSGKTTLIKMLVGEVKPDKGILEKGENVKIGYISQERWASDSHKTVIEEFLEATELPQTMARKILNRFSLTTEDVKKDVSILSPGEYSRLVIAKLVAIQPNCIILDEPSNHLDLQALEELEGGLKEYKGTLIVVSHDRYFIEKLKCNREFAV